MDRKVCFFDIDGTLLPSGADGFTPSALKAIREAKNNGHLMFINTGRVKYNMDPFMFDDAFTGFVCACGTYILIDGEVKFYTHQNDDVCQRIIELAEKYRMDIVFESHHGVYCDLERIKLPESRHLIDDLAGHGQMKFCLPQNFDKFVTWQRPDSDIEGFVQAISPWYDYIDRRQGFGEYVPKGHSKATGIQFILDYFGLALESAYAIGDSANDLAMLRYVPHAIAMGNSNPRSLFDEVEYVTTDIDNDGIKNALKHFNFI